MPGSRIKKQPFFWAIRALGRSLSQLKHLIFTHGHPDHIGSAAAIVRETGAKTYMHPLDIPMAESGGAFRPMRPGPGLIGLLCPVFFHFTLLSRERNLVVTHAVHALRARSGHIRFG